jgi:serine/threonine-protein kinase RsbW
MTDGAGDTLALDGRAGPCGARDAAWRSAPLLLAAEPAALDAIARYVGAVAARAEVGEEAAYRLRLAVEELAANAVLHGYAGRPGYLGVTGGADGRGAWIRLADAAPPFAPAAGRRPPDREVPVAERPVGGLGIHLALSAADGYAYEYADGENRSTVLVRRRTGRERRR